MNNLPTEEIVSDRDLSALLKHGETNPFSILQCRVYRELIAHRAADKQPAEPSAEPVNHDARCRFWDDDEHCDCGALERSELTKLRLENSDLRFKVQEFEVGVGALMQQKDKEGSALDKINKLIYSVGAPLGSYAYFKIRELCTKQPLTKEGG
jgi:hypothetical protein